MIAAPPRPGAQFCIDMMLRAETVIDHDRWALTLRDVRFPGEIYSARHPDAQDAKHWGRSARMEAVNRAVRAEMGQAASAANPGGGG